MADWPADGVTDWNTKMKANIDVGHDSDGTHKKSQMLTDMGWSPTAYTGGESVTYPNGFIEKNGSESLAANTQTTVTFGTAFPNSVVARFASVGSNVQQFAPVARATGTPLVSMYVKNFGSGSATIYWRAVGY